MTDAMIGGAWDAVDREEPTRRLALRIAALQEHALTDPGDASRVDEAVAALASVLRERALTGPDERRAVYDDIIATRPQAFPWSLVRPDDRGVAFLYQFAPWVDTGAVVASKRLRDWAGIVDVISTSGAQRRRIDPTISLISSPYVDHLVHLEIPQLWASWDGVRAYCGRAVDAAERLGPNRTHVYSRAMWVPSHFAGALYKVRHPEVPWIGEFSDPLSLDVEGLPRAGQDVPREEWFAPVLDEAERRWGPVPAARSGIFALAEWVVYALADEVLFTNHLQRDTMLAAIEDEAMRADVLRRSVVSNHPTLPEGFYDLTPTSYDVDPDKLNLAYFGEFYATRGIGDVTNAMRMLPEELRRQVELHVFTNYVPAGRGGSRPTSMSEQGYQDLVRRAQRGIGADGIEDQVRLNASLPYLEFLNVTGRFDHLIVCDARSGAHHAVNPYLPSKWSDYANSRAAVWAFVEEGSSLSAKPAATITPVGDPEEAAAALRRLIDDKRKAGHP